MYVLCISMHDLCTFSYIYIDVYPNICVYAFINICRYYLYMSLNIYACIYISVYVSMYLPNGHIDSYFFVSNYIYILCI